MGDVRYKITRDQKPTAEQIAEIEAARKMPQEYDEDCPEISPEKNKEMYDAMMKAVAERNQRIAGQKIMA